MKVAFVGIVKDGEAYLPRNLDRLGELGQDVYIVENNSVDGTKEILKDYETRGVLKKVVTLDLDGRNALSLCTFDTLCSERVRRLAYIRQQGLDAVMQSGIPYDYVCAVDLDFVSFDRDALMDMFGHMETHGDVDCMFGMSYASEYMPYDVSAVKPRYTLVPIYFETSRYVPVSSAFSGFGIYRVSSILRTGARYDYETITYVEHVHFNSYFDKALVDTQFKPVYEIDSYGQALNIRWGLIMCALLLMVVVVFVSAR